MKKYCGGCEKEKHLDEFRKRKNRSGSVVARSRCKECENLAAKEFRIKKFETDADAIREQKRRWAKQNPDSVRRTSRKRYLKTIGVEDVEQVLTWLYSLPMICQICDLSEVEHYQGLSIDHCHETGRVRGWLCSGCNSGLGYFRDSPHLLDKAKEYLARGLGAECAGLKYGAGVKKDARKAFNDLYHATAK